MKFKKSFSKISDKEVREVEMAIGFRIPEQHRDFLMQHNGGVPERDCFFCGDSDESILAGFYAINGKSHNDLRINIQRYRNRLPENMYPIAYDLGGNLILLSISGDDALYFWDHESEGHVEKGDLPKVGESIEDFLSRLHS